MQLTLDEQERAAYSAGDMKLAAALGALAEARALLSEARALLSDPDGDEFAAEQLRERIEEALTCIEEALT